MKQVLAATRLVVRHLPYAVQVLPHEQASVLLSAEEDLHAHLLLERFGETAVVRGLPPRPHLHTEEAQTPRPRPQMPRLDISVPRHTELAFSGIAQLTVGATESVIQLIAPPSTRQITIAQMRGGSLLALGGHVEIGAVNAEFLALTALGTGVITVEGGRVTHLMGSVVEQGRLLFHATAEVAMLSLKGSGIIAANAVRLPLCARIGDGQIQIGARPR